MCGITGIVNLSSTEPIERAPLEQAIRTLAHRGPDDEGIAIERNAGLAARRLSIIDVQDGHQPVFSEDGRVTAVMNGEIYNHCELRQQLIARGHRFASRVDTEILVHGYEEWGFEGCLEKLRGMYALAVWDQQSETMFLARDRLGIKPLFYTEYGGRLCFSSEIRGMLGLSGRPAEVHLDGLESFFTIGFAGNPHSMFEGVMKLSPGHSLTARNGRVSVKRYWLPFGRCEVPRTEEEAIAGFREILEDAVDSQLESEVPLGCLLSGGIDSTTIAALAQKRMDTPLETVSIGFEHDGFDESKLCLENARALGTRHHHVRFDEKGFDDYPRVLEQMEEPVKAAIYVVWDRLFKACREQGLTVVLSGAGADEALGGYYWHRREQWSRQLLGLPRLFRVMLANCPRIRSRPRLAGQLLAGNRPAHERYRDWITIRDPRLSNQLGELWSPELRGHFANGHRPILDDWSEYARHTPNETELTRMLWVQSQTRLIDDHNHELDRMSMAHSIETRVPFQDHRLWEYCMAVPDRWVLRRKGLRFEEKYLLRAATRGLIPEATRKRKKRGLGAPYDSWLQGERSPEWMEELLSPHQLRKIGFFSPRTVAEIRSQARSGRKESASLVMAVLAIQAWADRLL